MVDPAILSAGVAAAAGVLTGGVAAVKARRTPVAEPGDPAPLRAALEAIVAEPVPVLSSHDLTNVHIPASYAQRVQTIAQEALNG